MLYPKSSLNNIHILDNRNDEYSHNPPALGLTETLTANRPLADRGEALSTARSLNQILAFVEFSLLDKDKTFIPEEDIHEGLGEIIRACRLLSLRVEQFVNIEYDRKEHEILEKERPK